MLKCCVTIWFRGGQPAAQFYFFLIQWIFDILGDFVQFWSEFSPRKSIFYCNFWTDQFGLRNVTPWFNWTKQNLWSGKLSANYKWINYETKTFHFLAILKFYSFLRLFEDCEMRPEFIDSQSLTTKLDPN